MKDQATILAVDDTSESLSLLVRILSGEGYQVRAADSGELALAAVDANAPDLILLDVRMKGIDGLEVCRRLKACDETRPIPIILLSASTGAAERVQGLQLGAADYVSKPFEAEELLARVRTHLALRQAAASLEQQTAALRLSNSRLESEIVERSRMEDELRQNLDRAERSRRAMLSALEDQKRAEQSLVQQTAVTAAINRVLEGSLQVKSDAEVARICLAAAEELTGSVFGWIGETNSTGGVDIVALSDQGGQQDTATPPHAVITEDVRIGGVFSRVIREGKSLIANEVDSRPEWSALPNGHPALTAFLGVPLEQDGRTVGMVALGGKAGGYSEHDRTAVEALSVALATALQRKRSEAALRESEERFRGFIENASDTVCALTPDGVFTYLSPNWLELMGEPASEAVGKSTLPYLHPDDAHPFRDYLEQVLRTGQRLTSVNYRVLHRDGSVRWHSSRGTALRDGDGKVTGYLGIVRDVTERKLAEAEHEKLRERLVQS